MSTPRTVTVVFTEEEGKAALQLLDIAVKAGGLNVAKAGFIIADKINSAFLEGPTGNIGTASPEGVNSESGPVGPHKGPNCSYGPEDPRKL